MTRTMAAGGRDGGTSGFLSRGRYHAVRRTVTRAFLPLLGAALLALVLVLPTVAALEYLPRKRTFEDRSLDEDDHEYWLIEGGDEDWVDIEFGVTNDKHVDLYILTSDEYWNYAFDENFTPTKEWLNVTALDFNFTVPDDQSYRFVVDNQNNSGEDTPSEGNVIFNLTIIDWEIDFEELMSGIERAMERGLLVCCGIILVIILIIIAAIVLIVRSGRKPPPQMPIHQPSPYAPPPQRYPPTPPPPGG